MRWLPPEEAAAGSPIPHDAELVRAAVERIT